MKKIEHITNESDSHCFACSKTNPKGLKMEFYEDGDEVVSFWEPQWYYDGWTGMMHGGVMATLLDEIGEWLIYSKLKTVGVTTELNIKYRKPVKTTKGRIEIRGKIVRQIRNIVKIEAWILDAEKNRCAEANISYFAYTKERAKKDLDLDL